jgi:hypothetical protein
VRGAQGDDLIPGEQAPKDPEDLLEEALDEFVRELRRYLILSGYGGLLPMPEPDECSGPCGGANIGSGTTLPGKCDPKTLTWYCEFEKSNAAADADGYCQQVGGQDCFCEDGRYIIVQKLMVDEEIGGKAYCSYTCKVAYVEGQCERAP